MFAGGLLAVKQHRFEVVAAVLGGLVIGVWALVVNYRLDAVGAPPECIADFLIRLDGPGVPETCLGPMRAWGSVLSEANGLLVGEGTLAVSAMAVLPFAAGLLGGIPIVAGELEGGTAQTAWSLHASRMAWLARQAVPIGLLVIAAVAFAGVSATLIAAADVDWGHSAASHIGLHGPGVIARVLAAFGVGLLVGALIGRTLPAFILGAALSVALLLGVGTVHAVWLSEMEPMVIGEPSTPGGELLQVPRATLTGWGFRSPDGRIIPLAEAVQLTPPEVAEQDDIQYAASTEWLVSHGYVHLQLGITDEAASGWASYDALIFGLVGVASIGGAVVVVNRRRPS